MVTYDEDRLVSSTRSDVCIIVGETNVWLCVQATVYMCFL